MTLLLVRRRLAALSALILVATGLSVVAGATPATAATLAWSQTLTSVQPPNILLSHPDGSVTAAGGCLTAPDVTPGYSTTTMNPAAQLANRLQKYINSAGRPDWALVCDGKGTSGSDGTVYAAESSSQASWPYTVTTGIAAFKNGTKKWGRTAYAVCGSTQADPRWVSVGADGDVYAIYAGACQNNNDRLIGINSEDGTIKFNVQLATSFYNRDSFNRYMAAYDSGLVVLDGLTLRYFSYAGVEDTGKAHTFSLNTGEIVHWVAVSAVGKAFVSLRQNASASPPDPCGANNTRLKRILAHEPDGTSTTFSVASYCMAASVLRAMPDGGVAVQTLTSAGSYYSSEIYRFAADTSLTYQTLITQRTGFGSFWAAWMQVDANGKVYVPIAGTQTTGDPDRHVWVLQLGVTGTVSILFSTEYFASQNGVTETYRYTAAENGLGEGAYYITTCKSSACSSSAPPILHKVTDGSIGAEYPRMAVTPADTQLTYAAMADSYASGLGNGPYRPGTNVSGGNQCRRSDNAYPLRLERDGSTNLNLVDFSACAGATTQNVIVSGQYLEPKQIDAVPQDVDVLTVQVGGNDIEFAGGAQACALTADNSVCENTLDVVEASAGSPWFEDRVEATFDAIEAKSPQLVIVIGYFNFMLKGDNTTLCAWPLKSQTAAEAQSINNATLLMNGVLEQEAGERGFVFVNMNDEFHGHSICDTTPWINGADAFDSPQSYHPNTAGQQKLYELVKAEF